MSDMFGNHIVGFPTRRLKCGDKGSVCINSFCAYVRLNYFIYMDFVLSLICINSAPFTSCPTKIEPGCDYLKKIQVAFMLIKYLSLFMFIFFKDFQQGWDENFVSNHSIRKTYPCNEYPLKPHFYIAKLGYAGVYLVFLFLLQNMDCGYSLEPPRRGGSNVYPQSMF